MSPPTGLKRTPPGAGDVPQGRPSGPLLIKPKPAIKHYLRKSSRNYAPALLILPVFGCISAFSGYHVDALPFEKHNAGVKCGKLLIFLQSYILQYVLLIYIIAKY